MQERRGYWKAVVAIAAKNARMACPLGGAHPVFAMLYKLSQGLGMAPQIDLALR